MSSGEYDMVMYMMHMWFYQSSEAVFLFKDFETKSVGTYIVGLIITFLLAVSMEALSLAIFLIKQKSNESSQKLLGNIITISLYFLQLVIAFATMLLVMTFNVLIFLSVVLGVTVGYAIFGFWKMNLQSKAKETGYSCVAEKCCT